MTASRPRLVYVAGAGRSGSTILTRILASAPGVVAGGELVHIWDRGVRDDQLCGCGEPFGGCPHWRSVGAHAFGGWDTPAARRTAELRHAVDRQRHLPRIVLPGLGGASFRRDLRDYVDGYERLVAGIATAADAHTVVDSSKHGSTAHVLRHARRTDVQVVLLLRHPAAVSHSWTKRMARPEVRDRPTEMPVYAPASAASEWLSRVLEAQAVAPFGVPVHVLRYEDLMADPDVEIPRLAERLGLPTAPAVRDGGVDLGPDHTVAGHPNRFRTGWHDLVPDERWREDQDRRDRAVVTAVTAPVARAYGYRPGGAA